MKGAYRRAYSRNWFGGSCQIGFGDWLWMPSNRVSRGVATSTEASNAPVVLFILASIDQFWKEALLCPVR